MAAIEGMESMMLSSFISKAWQVLLVAQHAAWVGLKWLFAGVAAIVVVGLVLGLIASKCFEYKGISPPKGEK